MKRYIAVFLFVSVSFLVKADVYQWAVKIPNYISGETKTNSEAFMWIPETCEQVRGVVVSQQNMNEETIYNHPTFRKAMTELDFALVWIAPGIDYQWDVSTGCQDHFDQMLCDLAAISGYEEIEYVPIVPLGHSAMATFPWNFAAWNPERTLAVVSYKGDAPRTNLTGYGRENLEWGRHRNIDGIPGLMIEGEYEWWEARVNPALAFRMMYPESCISFLCDRGQGHFDASDKVIDYIILFLRKASEYRLPRSVSLHSITELKKIDPKNGWFASRWDKNQKKRPKPASIKRYRGNIHDAFWYFDKEIAEKTEAYYKEKKNREIPYIGFISGDEFAEIEEHTHHQYALTPKLNRDLQFELKAVLTDSSRMRVVSDKTVKLHKVNGPVKQINDSLFQVDFFRIGLNNLRRSGDIWLWAQFDENKKKQNAVQQINIRIPALLTEGGEQHINFPPIQNVNSGVKKVNLKAKSNKELNVSYYVKSGPAVVEGNKLVFTDIPPRTKYPVEVTVVAWQYGVPGEIQSAKSVERKFYIENN